MASATERSLVRGESSGGDLTAASAVGLAGIMFTLAMVVVFQQLSLTDTIAGVRLVGFLGVGLLALGLSVIGLGVASRSGVLSATPRASAGLLSGAVSGLLWAVVGGLAGARVLGLGTVGWLLCAVVVGAGAASFTVLTREDVGTTVPAGAFTALLGLVVLVTIGPSWEWALGWEQQPASLTASITVPTMTLAGSLVGGWAAAVAYGGFGARGRHLGAYLLVYLNAGTIVGVLLVLVGFTVFKGLPGLFRGFEVGLGVGRQITVEHYLFLPFIDFAPGFSLAFDLPFKWPFVMTGVALLNDVNGVWPAIVGTVWLVIGAVLLAVPLGVGAAIFLTEYAERGRFTQLVEVATNGLWSTPSIVFGLFGAAFLVPRFANQKSILAGTITLGFMLLPLVVITTRESLLAVPDEYRDASAALGVSKWQTIRSVVLPAAIPGVTTGVILGVGRIAGETAPILLTMTGAVALPANQALNVLGSFRFTATPPFVANEALLQATTALPYQLYALITAGVGKSSNIADIDQFRWTTALVLLVVVLSFYAIGIATRYYFRQKLNHE